jgi:hypothetical protein
MHTPLKEELSAPTFKPLLEPKKALCAPYTPDNPLKYVVNTLDK